MKILFESVYGKKVEKSFDTLVEAKEFVLKNKKAIKEAQVMEGPLGSGGWSPKKAFHNFKKGHERLGNLRDIDKTKDSFGNNISDYIATVANRVGREIDMPYFGCGRDEHGYYIVCLVKGYKKFDDDEYADKKRRVSLESNKYKTKIYMPKLTRYIEEHNSLPSLNQMKEYMKKLVEKRYENNLNIQKKKNPSSLTAKDDVDNF